MFTSTGGRVTASMIGTDEFFTSVNGRTFVVQNFALDNVDFTTSNGTTGDVTLKIQGLAGGDTSLTLASSSIASAITPLLYAPSVLAFNVSGTSQIKGWQRNMASATNLTVASGGTFRIKDSGLLNPSFPVETLNFSTDANHAILTNSTLQMALDPTGLTADRLVVRQQLELSSRVALSLSVANDKSLAPGTKFLLVDYPSLQSFPSDHFSGLTDGAVFTLGLNAYRINYNDPDVEPGQTHFITVTTVPEPSTLALLGLGALALAGRAVRRR